MGAGARQQAHRALVRDEARYVVVVERHLDPGVAKLRAGP
jgi:hypothetical protein